MPAYAFSFSSTLTSVDQEENPLKVSPEILLMLAVVERAVRDLSEIVPKEERRSAISWFERGFKGLRSRYLTVNFKDCIELCNFGKAELDYLREKVEKAREYENRKTKEALPFYQFKTKRKARRARFSSLPENPWLPYSQTEPAICRLHGHL